MSLDVTPLLTLVKKDGEDFLSVEGKLFNIRDVKDITQEQTPECRNITQEEYNAEEKRIYAKYGKGTGIAEFNIGELRRRLTEGYYGYLRVQQSQTNQGYTNFFDYMKQFKTKDEYMKWRPVLKEMTPTLKKYIKKHPASSPAASYMNALKKK